MAKKQSSEAEDQALASDIRQRINYLVTLIAKADRRSLTVDFQIRKTGNGKWAATQLDIRKRF